MANTFELIASSTVGSGGASSIDFSSIPSTYTDLQLNFSTRSNATDSSDSFDTIIKFNNSAANLVFKSLRGDGSGVNYNSLTDRMLRTTVPSNYTASTFSNVKIYIPNYAGSSNKCFDSDAVLENNATGSAQIFFGAMWSQTTAINQLTLVPNAGSFVQYSTAYLYGVKNA
jgi:hypothetical protein